MCAVRLEDESAAAIVKTKWKIKKAESLERFFTCIKTLASSESKKSCALFSGHFCARSLRVNLCLFYFTQFFDFYKHRHFDLGFGIADCGFSIFSHRSLLVKQAVCKTVAVSLWKFKSSPMHQFDLGFEMSDLGFILQSAILNPKSQIKM